MAFECLVEGPGCSVPESVLQRLQLAYGAENIGKVGCDLEGHAVEKDNWLGGAAETQSSLVYGELLPEGASKALCRLGLTRDAPECDDSKGGCLLELGMGTGILALQAFLQCSQLHEVIGVELSASRCRVATRAVVALAAADPKSFEIDIASETCADDSPQPVLRCKFTDVSRECRRSLLIFEGDMTALPSCHVCQASAIFLQVVLPEAVNLRVQDLLQRVPDGCLVFMLDDLRCTWGLPEPSILHALEDTGEDDCFDRYATSWNARGHRFYVLVADRTKAPTITQASAQLRMDTAASDGHAL